MPSKPAYPTWLRCVVILDAHPIMAAPATEMIRTIKPWLPPCTGLVSAVARVAQNLELSSRVWLPASLPERHLHRAASLSYHG